jgi:DNA-binding MarR family transcriptional regulator
MTKLPKSCPADEVVIHPALKEYFTYRFYKLALKLRAEVNQGLAVHGILGIQLGLLRVLALEGAASQIALGRSMGIDKATMVKLLDDLEKSGLVQRVAVEGDRRVKHIRITARGSKLLKAGTRVREQVEKRFFSALTPAECSALDKALAKLLDRS